MTSLSYPEILERLFSSIKGNNASPSLLSMEKLSANFNHPHRSYPTIHVAGTNGKGSVCTKIASALQAEGYRTGLYTSPHIASFCERIQVDGIPITEEEIVSLFPNIEAPFFELTTLLALLHFQMKQVDVAVIETGLGGRYDATNIITPLLSIITSIGLDHTEILGPTIAHIAHAKAGIIKPAVPILIGPDVPCSLIQPIADALQSPLHQTTSQSSFYDRENQALARDALSLLSSRFPLSPNSIEIGLKAKPPCRFETHKREKKIVLDVAHNAHGFHRLIQALREIYPNHTYRFILGFSKNKDLSSCAPLIQSHASAIHLIDTAHPRLATTTELSTFFPYAYLESSIPKALRHALSTPSKSEIVVIAGSFFIMEEIRQALANN